MNIFFLDKCPYVSASMCVDKHVVKMILESAQLLSTAHRLLDGTEIAAKSKTGRNVKRWVLDDDRENILYSATHINHPSAIWIRKSIPNYVWLSNHMDGLIQEYKYRYGKTHKVYSSGLAAALEPVPNNMSSNVWTIPPSAMAKEYIVSDDPVTNYRNYYINGKKHLHKWSKRSIPNWMQL